MDASLEIVTRAGGGRWALKGTAGGLSLVLDELAYGVLLTTARGQVLHANAVARQELIRRRLLLLEKGVVQASGEEQGKLLALALAKAERGRRSLVALRSESARISLAAVPLRADRGAGGAQVALILSRPAVCDAVMLCFFARAQGLTPAEEQVLALLCQGYSAPEAARHLCVAVSTVRSHVRSMCAKTGSNGVRALVGQVAVLPPIGAAHVLDPLH